ncbi:AIR synthase-related protein [Halobaculum sp. MBLA0147]|uniref:AIR synthase-related protein n=1 Tax=Halobaculum sp. MBLA0147 TaxID=3079934 RepID=UPI003524B661
MSDDTAADERLGKVDGEFFEEYVFPHLGADREDVRLGPAHGVDFGVLDVDGRALVTATDPVSILPELGFARAGRFALHFALADVAVSGVAPSHLCVSFALPTDVTDEQFAALWTAVSAECEALGIAVATGHTARYPEASYPWVGAATVLGLGAHDDVIRPDAARPGDTLVVTEGPGIETAGLLTTLFPDAPAFASLDDATLADARACLDRTGVTRDALAAVDAVDGVAAAAGTPISAMHDATEGGLRGALCEMATAGGVRFDVDTAAVPTDPAALAVADALDVDPWACTTSGTLLLAVAPDAVDAVLDAFADRGTRAAAVGEVSAGSGVYLDGERVEPPAEDPSWAAFANLAEE